MDQLSTVEMLVLLDYHASKALEPNPDRIIELATALKAARARGDTNKSKAAA